MGEWVHDDRTDNYQTEGLDVKCVTCMRDGSAVKTVFQTSLNIILFRFFIQNS